MKCIIAGTRDISHYEFVRLCIERCPWHDEITEVVSGDCRGVDVCGAVWGNDRGLPVRKFPADWKAYGFSAGPLRNRQMAEYADALIAIWDGESRGTANMIKTARDHGLRVWVFNAQLDVLGVSS